MILNEAPERRKLTAGRAIPMLELTNRPGIPSDILRSHEADLVGKLARQAHLEGGWFEGRPIISAIDHSVAGGPGWGAYPMIELHVVGTVVRS